MAFEKTYDPIQVDASAEAMESVRFQLTNDGLRCQIHVKLGGRTWTLNPGNMGTEAFNKLWDERAPADEDFQAILNAVPDLTDEQRGVAVAAPETI